VGTLFQDIRYAWRTLRKDPGFALVGVLTLALGIGANTAIFSMVDSFLLRPLPVKDPAQIVSLAYQQKKGPLQNNFSVPELEDLQRQTSAALSDVFAFQFGAGGITRNGKTQPVTVNYVSGNFFTALGIKPELGRFIVPGEGDPSVVNPVLVLGYNYWKTHFGADPSIVGQTVSYNGQPMTVIGVAPRGFHGLYTILDAQGYLPLGMLLADSSTPKDMPTNRELRYMILLGRLQSGVRLNEAQSVLQVVSQRLSHDYPKSEEGIAVKAFPERLSRPQPDLDNTMLKMAALFLILAALVLLLACGNVANFLLVRATVRQRELAIRAALGGSRSRLIRQLLTESVLLALCGGFAGVLLGLWGTAFLSSIHLQTTLPVIVDFQFDWRVFLYAFSAALTTGVFVGIVPALRASNGHMLEVIREGGRTVTSSRNWLRSGLVVAQVAGSLMLLIVAGLMTRSLAHVRQSSLGFEPQRVLNMTLDPVEIGYNKEQGLAFYKQLLERVTNVPGVQSASVAFSTPLGYYNNGDTLDITGYEMAAREAPPSVGFNQVTPGYFRTLSIPLLQGRDFDAKDAEGAQAVAIVNEAMAAKFWPQMDPIGREFKMVSDRAHPMRVVGVAKNSRTTGLTGPVSPFFYVPFAQQYSSIATLQVRSVSTPESIAGPIREQVSALAPAMPIFDVRPMLQGLETLNGFLVFELAAGLAGAMGLLGLVLAVVGVFGVISFSVSQRTHEIGIRMALGAGAHSVLQMIVRQGTSIVALGLTLGILMALGIARLVGSFLAVSPFDPLTYVSVTLALTLVALLACYIPARRATRVDPMVALRYE
jgi:predicted permease